MSKQANPAVIGTFVVGAALLAVAAILVLGSGRFFEETEEFVMYFDGDLTGLDVGAAVQYRGMRIGTVKSMRLELDTDTGDSLCPVYIQLEKGRFIYTGKAHKGRGLDFQVKEKGLRGQLQPGSLITGKKKIALVEAPETPIHLVGADRSVPEIPTIPTVADALLKSLSELPFEDIVKNLNDTLKSVSDLAGSDEVREAVASVSRSSERLDTLLTRLESTVPELVKSTTATAEETRAMLADMKPAIARLEPVMRSIQEGVDGFRQVEDELAATLQEARAMLSERSPVRYEITLALERLGGAAEGFRQFIDYLQRHPEALLAGKGNVE